MFLRVTLSHVNGNTNVLLVVGENTSLAAYGTN